MPKSKEQSMPKMSRRDFFKLKLTEAKKNFARLGILEEDIPELDNASQIDLWLAMIFNPTLYGNQISQIEDLAVFQNYYAKNPLLIKEPYDLQVELEVLKKITGIQFFYKQDPQGKLCIEVFGESIAILAQASFLEAPNLIASPPKAQKIPMEEFVDQQIEGTEFTRTHTEVCLWKELDNFFWEGDMLICPIDDTIAFREFYAESKVYFSQDDSTIKAEVKAVGEAMKLVNCSVNRRPDGHLYVEIPRDNTTIMEEAGCTMVKEKASDTTSTLPAPIVENLKVRKKYHFLNTISLRPFYKAKFDKVEGLSFKLGSQYDETLRALNDNTLTTGLDNLDYIASDPVGLMLDYKHESMHSDLNSLWCELRSSLKQQGVLDPNRLLEGMIPVRAVVVAVPGMGQKPSSSLLQASLIPQFSQKPHTISAGGCRIADAKTPVHTVCYNPEVACTAPFGVSTDGIEVKDIMVSEPDPNTRKETTIYFIHAVTTPITPASEAISQSSIIHESRRPQPRISSSDTASSSAQEPSSSELVIQEQPNSHAAILEKIQVFKIQACVIHAEGRSPIDEAYEQFGKMAAKLEPLKDSIVQTPPPALALDRHLGREPLPTQSLSPPEVSMPTTEFIPPTYSGALRNALRESTPTSSSIRGETAVRQTTWWGPRYFSPFGSRGMEPSQNPGDPQQNPDSPQPG